MSSLREGTGRRREGRVGGGEEKRRRKGGGKSARFLADLTP